MDGVISGSLYFLSNIGKIASGSGRSTMLLIIFGVFVLAVIGFWLGRSRILISIISVFAAYFVENNFNFLSGFKLNGLSDYTIKLGVFVVAFIVIFFVMSRSVLRSRITVKDSSIISIAVLSIINAGLLASVVILYLPIDQGIIPAQFFDFLATKTARLIWAVLAIVAMFFLKGKRESSVSKLK